MFLRGEVLLKVLHYTKQICFILMTFGSAIVFNQIEMVGEMISMVILNALFISILL